MNKEQLKERIEFITNQIAIALTLEDKALILHLAERLTEAREALAKAE